MDLLDFAALSELGWERESGCSHAAEVGPGTALDACGGGADAGRLRGPGRRVDHRDLSGRKLLHRPARVAGAVSQREGGGSERAASAAAAVSAEPVHLAGLQ